MIDTKTVADIFGRLGDALKSPASLCLIGSTPGIANGQSDRQTPDFDIWQPMSDYDTGDLARACRELGISFDPTGETEPGQVYVQIVRPGIVGLPAEFDVEVVGRFGNLTIVMPTPAVLVAAKLVRSTEIDIDDVVWWVSRRGLDASAIKMAIEKIPGLQQRRAATENIIYVQLVMGKGWE